MSKHARPTSGRLPDKHAYPNPRLMHWKSTVLAVLFSLVLFTGTAVALVYNNITTTLGNQVIETENLGAATASPAPTDSFEGRPVNILITGIDSRYGENGQMGAGDSDEIDSIRTDTNMVMHISADRQSASVISIPRDLMVDIPECRRSDGSTTYETFEQFNSAFALGAGTDDIAGGIACTESTVEQMTGIEIDGFIIIDFAGFEKVMEVFGGVDLCVEQDLKDRYTGIDLKAGCQHLDADIALKYARVRHDDYDNIDGSDIGRIGRQQQLVGALMQQILSTNILTDMNKLYSTLQQVLETINVSSAFGNLNTDLALVSSIKNIGTENIRFVTLPWTDYPQDPNRVTAVEPLATQLWESIANDTSLPPGIEYKDISNKMFIVGADGESIEVDEDGNPIAQSGDTNVGTSNTGTLNGNDSN